MDQHNNQGFGQFYVEDYGAAAGTNETLQGHAHGEENFSNFTQANLWESTNPAFQPQYTTSGVNHGFTNDYANAGYEQQAAFQNQAPGQSPPQFQNSQYGGMFNDMGQPAQFHDYSNNFSAQPPQAQHPNPSHQTTISQVNPAGLSFVGQQQPSQPYQQSHPQQAGQPDQFLQHQFVAYEHGDHRMSHSIPQNQHGKMNAQPQIAPALQQPQGVPYDTYHQTSQPAQYSHQPDQGHFGAPFHSFGIQEARVQSSASPSNAQPLAPASNRTPQQVSSLPPQQMAQAQGHPQQPLVSAQQVIGAASNGMPLQPSAKPSARAAQVIDGPPRVVEDLVKSRSRAQEEELFPGVPYLVVGSPRMAEPVKVPDMPMVQLDMSRNLGRAHLGQKQPLACELIKTYTDEATEHPENRDALKAQLIQQFKQQGKTVPWKAYGLKGWGQAGKDASPEADESDYESEVEEVRSATRPSDPVEAAAWDAIGIVYLDAEAAKDKKSVGAAVKAFGDFIKKIREDIKAEPETKDPNVLSPNQQRLLRAVEAAEEKGDDQVLVNLGGNNPLISNLVFSLHNLPKTADLSGELPKAVLRLLSRCSLHQDILEKVKFPRLEKRLMEKGDDEVKRLVKSVHKAVKRDDKTDMARSSSQQGATHPASKSSVASSDTSTENGTASKAARPASRIPSDTASSKRPREDEPDARASKKFAADPANGAAQAPSKASPTKNASTVTQHTVAPAKPWSGSALLPGKTRPAVKPAAKTDGLKTEKAEPSKTAAPKSGVLSKTDVSKLVATKRDPLKAEATKVKKPVVSRAEPSSSSKLGALLQEISMPKKQPAASTTPEAVPEKFETPEEKEKRLRKEKRRHLRVSWKEGDELTQVRVFQKDIEEDEGREDNMIRDARDDRSEGMVLKQSLKQGGMDVDDDEEEDDDILYTPWVAPTPFDLSSLPAEKREKNYITRGGTLPIRTQQQKEMQDRENNVLMVVYTAASDIPPTPKSPAQSYNDPQQPKPPPGVHLPTNDPRYYEFHQRWTENQRLGSSWASHNALQRAESRQMGGAARGLGTGPQGSTGHSGKPFFPWPSAKRSEEVLSLLQSDRVKKWTTSKPYDPNNSRTIRRHDYPDPAVQAAADGVETVAAQLKGQPFPATEPPSYITDPARVKEWYEGYNREQERKQALHAPSAVPAAASPADYAAMVEYYSKLGYAIPQPPTTQVQLPYDQAYAPYYNQQAQAAQVSAAQQQAGGDANAQLQALMATLAGTGAQNAYAAPAALAPPQPDPSNDPQVQALLASLGSGVPQGQIQYPGQPAMPVPNTNDPAQQAYLAAFAQWAAGQHAAGTPTQQQAVAPPPDGPIPGQQQQQSKNFGNEYKQQREQPDSRDSGSGGRGQGQQGKHHAREAREAKQAREARDSQDPSIPSHLRGINRNLIGTKPCTFWRQNKCAKGDKCTFRHD